MPASIHLERLTYVADGHLRLLLLHLSDHRVPLRDGSCCKAFFNTAFSTANCPQNRSNSATFASSAWLGVGSAGAKAASPRVSYSCLQRATKLGAKWCSRHTCAGRFSPLAS